MNLTENAKNTLTPLTDLLKQISQTDYSRELNVLSGNTIGKHVRHILEFFQCLLNGYESQVVNYDQRKRNPILEHDLYASLEAIAEINLKLDQKKDQAMHLLTSTSQDEDTIQLGTTYFRELSYNIEHTVHHLAIIRIAVEQEIKSVVMQKDFGYAASTVRYRNNSQ